MANPSQDGTGPLFAADQLSIYGAYKTLLAGSKHIDVRGTGLHLVRTPGGENMEPGSGQENNSHTVVDDLELNNIILDFTRPGRDPLRFDVHHLNAGPFERGKTARFDVAMTNSLPPGEVKAEGSIGPWIGDLGTYPVLGSYSFERANLGVFSDITGTLSSEGKFKGTVGQIQVDAKVQVSDFQTKHSGHSVNLEGQFQAEVNGTNGDVLLRNSALSWEETTLLARGKITGPKGEGKTADLDLQVSHGRMQDLTRIVMHSASTLEGPVVFRGRAVLPPDGGKFLKRIRFTTDFNIEKARFSNPTTQAKVNLLSKRARGDKGKDSELVYLDLKGHIDLFNGVARFSNSTFTVPAAVVDFKGACDVVRESLDLHGHLLMTATASQAQSGFKSALLKPLDPFFKNRKKGAGADIPVKMTGSFFKPQFGIDVP